MDMMSKVLVIADATWQASVLILNAFQEMEERPMEVRGIFLSCLIEPFKKNLGPNTLYLLLEEEEKALARVRDYFARSDIPHSFELITASPLESVRTRAREEDYGLIILQGEFIEFLRSDERLHKTSSWIDPRSRSPILLIKKSVESSLSDHQADCGTSRTEPLKN